MKVEDFCEILGDIDESYVEQAKTDRKAKRSGWMKWGAMAACLCLIAAGAAVVFQLDFLHIDTGSGENGLYSVSVFPATERPEDVASAEVVSLTESEALNSALAAHLPQQLPEGFHYGRGSIYHTVMKDGTQYNMLRIEYLTGTIPEQKLTDDGGAVAPDLEVMGEYFTVCVMNFEPKTHASIYPSSEEVTGSILEETGAAYLQSGDCYVGVFTETAEPAAVLQALKSIDNQ